MSFSTKLYRWGLFLLLVMSLIIMSTLTTSLAQPTSPPGRLVFTNTEIYLGSWTSDETHVGVVLDPSTYEFEYLNAVNGQIDQLPSSVQLSTAELSFFGIDISVPDAPRSQYSISPDGAYVAYSVPANPASPHDESYGGDMCESRQLQIANRQTKVTSDIPMIVGAPTAFAWGKDSRGLLILSLGACEGLGSGGPTAYVSNLSPTLTNLRFLQLKDVASLNIDSSDVQILSISRDGLRLLAVTAPHNGSSPQLVVIDVVNPTQSTVIAQNIDGFLTASFDYGTPTSILMLSAAGLTQLNLAGQQSALNSVLTTTGNNQDCSPQTFVRDAVFSPSGRWLAYIYCDSAAGLMSLYVVDMNDIRHPGSPTPTVAPTYTPVGVTANLDLASVCSPTPTAYRTWRIRNSNAARVDFGWTLVGGGLDAQGYGVVPPAVGAQPGEVFLSTPTISGNNTLQVSVNGIDQGSVTGTATQCGSQTSPTPHLQLASMCSPLADGYRLWRVHNTTSTARIFTWTLNQSTQTCSGSVPAGTTNNPGETFFITRPEATNPSAKLYVNNVLQATTADNGTQCGSSSASIQYYPESTTRTQYVESIIPQLNIINTDITPIPLSELKIMVNGQWRR